MKVASSECREPTRRGVSASRELVLRSSSDLVDERSAAARIADPGRRCGRRVERLEEERIPALERRLAHDSENLVDDSLEEAHAF
jgi:hypothetical protein